MRSDPSRYLARARTRALRPISYVVGLLTLLAAGCVSVGIEVKKPAKALAIEPLVVFLHEGTWGRKQAATLAAELREELAEAGITASFLVIGEAELKDDAVLAQARAGRHTLLRMFPVAGARTAGEVSQVRYDVALVALPDETSLWSAQLAGRSGVLSGPLRRRQRRLARTLVSELSAVARPEP